MADETELQSLLSDTRAYGIEDLKSALRQQIDSGESDDADSAEEDQEISLLADDAAEEINRRVQLLGAAYPFVFDGSVLTSTEWGSAVAYVFLLLMSMPAYKGQLNGALYFEQLVTDALRSYIGGRAIRFGWPKRAPVPSHPIDAVAYLAEQLGEPRNPLGHIRAREKDMGLDAVAWKPFPDQRTGQVVMLGACATGVNWRRKIGELILHRWQNLVSFTVPPALLFAVPWVPEDEDWAQIQESGYIVFDRLRAVGSIGKWSGNRSVNNWCRKRLKETAAELI